MATDNHLVPHLAALLKSIELNHKSEEQLNIIIIDDGISEKNVSRIKNDILSDKINLNFIKAKDVIPKGVHLPIDRGNYPLTVYLRLFIPYILPAGINKVIFIDVDTIVLDDLSKFYEFDLGDNIIGAITDASEVVSCEWLGIPNYKELGIPPDAKYFNAGVLLINIEAWKRYDVTNKVMRTVEQNIKYTNFCEQYGLNVVLWDKWAELPETWNCFAEKKLENPSIIHFTAIKPIYKSYFKNEDYKAIFYQYLQKTSWKNFKPINEYHRLGKKIKNRLEKIYTKLFK
jgi:Lipopolysaccharide biosynthesis proteins, LPS:glycosyltransferases